MKKPHYYYQISVTSVVADQLQVFVDQCADAAEQARLWAEKQGADHYIESPKGMSGGIIAVEFDNTIAKEGWERIDTPTGDVYFLPAEGSALEKEMEKLPVVNEAALFGILSLVPNRNKKGVPLPMTFGNTTPIIFKYKDYWYVDAPYKSDNSNVALIDEHYFNRQKRLAISDHIQK